MKQIRNDIYYLGANNCEQRIFEGEIPLKKGMSYNSYLITDEYTCLLDTCDESVLDEFIDNLNNALDGRRLDYFIIHHLEPDHTAGIIKVLKLFPDTCVLISPLGMNLLKQFFPDANVKNFRLLKEGDTLDLGIHQLTFISAPMVHWPEVMMSYDNYAHILFAADAFGSFTCFDELYSEDYPNQDELLYEERRYYTNIVGKYGDQVQAVLKKAKNLNIEMICSLHGPIHTKRIPSLLKYYDLWSRYEKEKDGVLIVYATIYGHSRLAKDYLVNALKLQDKAYDVVNLNKDDFSIALSKSFIFDKIILIAPTFNMNLFPKMREYIDVLIDHQIINKTFALIENGSWAPQAKNIMNKSLQNLKKCKIIPTSLTIKSSLKEQDYPILDKIIEELEIKKVDEMASNSKKWRCRLCGFIYEGETLDESFTCPLCGRDSSFFDEVK